MKRTIRFIGLLIRLKLSHMMLFRLSFFGAFFADGALFIMQLLTFQVIYRQVDTIGGWSRGQMLIFIGTFSLLNGIQMVIFFFGVADIPSKIHEGRLDHYLTKPMNALLRITFESADLGSFPLILLSIGIVAYGIRAADITVSATLLLPYLFLLVLMTVLWYDLEVMLRTLSFFFIPFSDIDPIESLEGDLLTLNFKVPGVVYKGFYKILFYLILPYGLLATVPTQALTGTLPPFGFCYALGVTVLFTAFAQWFWRFGVKHYKSASS